MCVSSSVITVVCVSGGGVDVSVVACVVDGSVAVVVVVGGVVGVVVSVSVVGGVVAIGVVVAAVVFASSSLLLLSSSDAAATSRIHVGISPPSLGLTSLHRWEPMPRHRKLSEHLKCRPIDLGVCIHQGTMCGSPHMRQSTCLVSEYLATCLAHLAAAPLPDFSHLPRASFHARLLVSYPHA